MLYRIWVTKEQAMKYFPDSEEEDEDIEEEEQPKSCCNFYCMYCLGLSETDFM